MKISCQSQRLVRVTSTVCLFLVGVIPAFGQSQNELTVQDGMVLWLKADAGVEKSEDGAVTEWLDQSAKGNDAFVRPDGPESERPRWVEKVVNGQAALRFDGEDDVLQIENAASLQPGEGDWTVFFVGRRLENSQGDVPQIIGSRPWTAGLDNGWAIVFTQTFGDTPGLIGSHFADGETGHDTPANFSTLPWSQETFEIWQVEESQTEGVTTMARNGTVDHRTEVSMPESPVEQENPIFIGREIGGSNNRRANMELAEIIIYERALSETEANEVTQYLSGKYELELNEPPQVSLVDPADGAEFAAPTDVKITAEASDNTGEVMEVAFFANGQLLKRDTERPFRVTMALRQAGEVNLTAMATDDAGAQSESSETGVTINVSSEGTVPSEPVQEGLQLWLRADQGISADSDQFVSSWEGQTPNANEAIQNNEFVQDPEDNFKPKRIEDAINGKPVVRFDGVDDFMLMPNSSSLQPGSDDWSVFLAARRGSSSQGDVPQIIGSRPWEAGVDKGWAVVFTETFGEQQGLVGSHFADGSAGHDTIDTLSTSPLSRDRIQVWQVEEDRENGLTSIFRNGGLNQFLRTAMPTSPIDQQNDIFIGSEIEGGDFRRANIDIGEILIYNRVLTEEERNRVTDYLLGKYGLPGVSTVFPAPEITSHPQDVTVKEGGEATFSIDAPGESLVYQWQKNGSDLPEAFESSLTVSDVALDDSGATYRVLISNEGGRVTSEEATLTVTEDREPPQLVSVTRNFFDTTMFRVRFSEPVSAPSATSAGNYSVGDVGTISTAALGVQANEVIVTTSQPVPPETSLVLEVENVEDRFGNAITETAQFELPSQPLFYRDPFTLDDARTDGLFNDNSGGAYEVAESFENPTATWTPTDVFRFVQPQSAANSELVQNAEGNPGAESGLIEVAGASGDASFGFGVSSMYAVQVEAILPDDRLDISSLGTVGGGITEEQGLSVFFRRDSREGDPFSGFPNGIPGIDLFSSSAGDTGISKGDPGVTVGENATLGNGGHILTGVNDDNWHAFRVVFNQESDRLRIEVDGKLKATVDLTTFANGAYQDYSNSAVGVGGNGNEDQAIWLDNFVVLSPVEQAPSRPGGLEIQRDGAEITVSWKGKATLEKAESVTGPFQAVPEATSPYQVSPGSTKQFYRLAR